MSKLDPGFCSLIGREAVKKGLSAQEFAFGGRTGKNEKVSILDSSRFGEKSFGGEF